MAQLGSALDWGSRGRRFKSCQPDVMKKDRIRAVFFHPSGLPGGPAGSKNCITDVSASAAAILSRAVQPDLSGTEDFFHCLPFGELIHEFVEIPNFLNLGVADFFDTNSADDTGTLM